MTNDEMELEEKLIFEVVPAIIDCKKELSAHNKSGVYGFWCDGKYLCLKFDWFDKKI